MYHLTFNISKHKITSNWKLETSTMLADCSLNLWASSTTNQSNLQQVNRQATEIVESIHILSTTQRNNIYSTASLPQPQRHHIFELVMINDHQEGVTANNNQNKQQSLL